VRAQPGVDAAAVEEVAAQGQHAHDVAVLQLLQAHHALHRPRRRPPLAAAPPPAAERRRRRGPRAVRERGQRGDVVHAEPDPRPGRRRRAVAARLELAPLGPHRPAVADSHVEYHADEDRDDDVQQREVGAAGVRHRRAVAGSVGGGRRHGRCHRCCCCQERPIPVVLS